MASSSSSQRGAARAPPPPEQLALFYKLADKQVIAAVLCRHARSAELSASAAAQAEALLGDDSLVVANMRMGECDALGCLVAEASGAELMALYRRLWDVLLSLIPLLLRRVEANTLLPGTVREEELAYTAHEEATVLKSKNKPVPPLAELRGTGSAMGYNTLVLAIFRSLELLRVPLFPVVQKTMVEPFVLQGLDVIPRTASIRANLFSAEDSLVAFVKEKMKPRGYEPGFYAAVIRKWRSHAVGSVLRARGVLQTGTADFEQSNADFEARKRADIAMHGLRDCALPSCSKTEKTVKESAGCSGCRSVVY